MDHAGDIAHALVTAGFSVRRGPESTRKKQTLVVQARDWPSWYRVTISEIEPTETQLYWPELYRLAN